ncbi:prepilin peptidase [Vibrio kagoshimensis]|uniref:A24 family peptidase n=1 Tax=Vibrio kagoshimensis TaxID=2910244 RepID=UPI003D20BCC0
MLNNLEWLIILAALFIYVSATDVISRTISNKACLAIAAGFFLYVIETGSWFNIVHSVLILGFGIILSQLKLLAGGDTKLFAAYSLAIPSAHLLNTIILILLIGGVVSVIYLLWVKLEKKTNRGVPYGIAISLGSSLGILASI